MIRSEDFREDAPQLDDERDDNYESDNEEDFGGNAAESSRQFSFVNAEDDEDNEDEISGMESTDDMNVSDEEEYAKKRKEDNDIDPAKFGLKPGKAKNIYCNNAELIEEIRKFQRDGVATNKLGELIIKIALHMTTMTRFWRYPHALKEELAQNAIYRMLLSVPKFDLKNDKANAFGYFSMISYRDMLHTLKKHFKQNSVREAIADAYLSKLAQNPNDERIGMLRQTLEKSEEYNAFMRSKSDGEKEVDTFALSRAEQERRYRASRKGQQKKTAK